MGVSQHEDPNDLELIRGYARKLLAAADALGRVPTPLDELARAAKLAPAEYIFQEAGLPSGLLAVVRRLRGKIKAALAIRERTIYIASHLDQRQKRFAQGHELGHDYLPWHQQAYFGDDTYTLLPETKNRLEQQASLFSAELLFQLELFAENASEYALGLGAALDLAETWDASFHSTIRRYVETNSRPCGLLILGRFVVFPDGEPSLKILNCFESSSFRSLYGRISERMPKTLQIESCELAQVARRALRGGLPEPVIEGEFFLGDGINRLELRYQVFSNSYLAFVLLFPPKRLTIGRKVRPVWVSKQALSDEDSQA